MAVMVIRSLTLMHLAWKIRAKTARPQLTRVLSARPPTMLLVWIPSYHIMPHMHLPTSPAMQVQQLPRGFGWRNIKVLLLNLNLHRPKEKSTFTLHFLFPPVYFL